MKTTRKILAVLLALAMVMAFAACGQKEAVVEGDSETEVDLSTATFQKEIVIGCYDSAATMDCSGSTGISHLAICDMVFDGLVKFDENKQVVGECAEKIEWLDDNMTIQFTLRQGMQFHGGYGEVKASDVKYSVQHAIDKAYVATYYSYVEEVEVISDYVVQFHLSAPAQDLLPELTLSCFGIMSEKACTEDEDSGYLIGCGPYYVETFELGNYTEVVRFDDYYGELPKTERFNFKVMSEASARLVALQTGEIDFCMAPAAAELANIEADPNLKLYSGTGVTLQYLALNLKNEKWADKRLRQAVAYAINRDDVIVVAAEGNGTPAYTVLPSTCFGYVGDDVNPYTYDKDKANALLKEAGQEGYEVNIQAYTSVKVLQAQALQANLNAAGFNASVEQIEYIALYQQMKAATHDAVLWNWAGGSLCPDNVFRPMFHSNGGSNRSKTDDETVNNLIDTAMPTIGDANREPIYKELQENLMSNAGLIPLYFDNVYVACKASVQGFVLNEADIHNFAAVYIVEE